MLPLGKFRQSVHWIFLYWFLQLHKHLQLFQCKSQWNKKYTTVLVSLKDSSPWSWDSHSSPVFSPCVAHKRHCSFYLTFQWIIHFGEAIHLASNVSSSPMGNSRDSYIYWLMRKKKCYHRRFLYLPKISFIFRYHKDPKLIQLLTPCTMTEAITWETSLIHQENCVQTL